MKTEININLENDKSISFKYYKRIKEKKIAFVIETQIYDKFIEEHLFTHIIAHKNILKEKDYIDQEYTRDIILHILDVLLDEKMPMNLYGDKINKIYEIAKYLIDNENKEIFVTDLFRIVLK